MCLDLKQQQQQIFSFWPQISFAIEKRKPVVYTIRPTGETLCGQWDQGLWLQTQDSDGYCYWKARTWKRVLVTGKQTRVSAGPNPCVIPFVYTSKHACQLAQTPVWFHLSTQANRRVSWPKSLCDSICLHKQTRVSAGPNPCVIPFVYTVRAWESSEHQLKALEATHICKDLYVYMLLRVLCLVIKLCLMLLQPHGLQPTRLHCPWDFPGKNTGLSCHFLLQGIFPTQGSNLFPALAGGFFTSEPHTLKTEGSFWCSKNLEKFGEE